ncbi:hypothetical protein MAPG_04232 [Magnaporthiopsis poae ATCC 64411]|uniref:Uncharacterized protein n=1 Tax=Magnaporthiopsis poae (strain ATCC 64411 / 73-15) TaxID=644358 RepID=A0A0C4DW58_MAGP6|nr:hypothetical protein MAPG_04232 [Magnaporthiopsis poae ATCC 64411]
MGMGMSTGISLCCTNGVRPGGLPGKGVLSHGQEGAAVCGCAFRCGPSMSRGGSLLRQVDPDPCPDVQDTYIAPPPERSLAGHARNSGGGGGDWMEVMDKVGIGP